MVIILQHAVYSIKQKAKIEKQKKDDDYKKMAELKADELLFDLSIFKKDRVKMII